MKRGAPVNVVDDVYGTPPLVWALHAWLVEQRIDADQLRADRDLYAVLSARAAER